MRYNMHEGLLCHHSSYFRGAIRGGFGVEISETNEKIIRLNLIDLKVFESFKLWLYTGKLFSSSTKPTCGPRLNEALVNIWVFADMRGIPGMRNAATDGILDRVAETGHICVDVVPKVYAETMEGSALRCLYVDLIRFQHSLSYFGTKCKELGLRLPVEFLYDVMEAYCAHGQAWTKIFDRKWHAAKMDRCKYHEHQSPSELLAERSICPAPINTRKLLMETGHHQAPNHTLE